MGKKQFPLLTALKQPTMPKEKPALLYEGQTVLIGMPSMRKTML